MTIVKISDLIKDGERYYYMGNPFNGQALELSKEGIRIREYHFWDGFKHGSIRDYYSDGSNYSDVRYEKGVPSGLGFEWDMDGNRTQLLYRDGVEVERLEPKSKTD